MYKNILIFITQRKSTLVSPYRDKNRKDTRNLRRGSNQRNIGRKEIICRGKIDINSIVENYGKDGEIDFEEFKVFAAWHCREVDPGEGIVSRIIVQLIICVTPAPECAYAVTPQDWARSRARSPQRIQAIHRNPHQSRTCLRRALPKTSGRELYRNPMAWRLCHR